MTNSLIPYSFTPGTKAKAQEVNDNFIAVAERIQDTNKNLTNQITDLQKNLSNEINNINENNLDSNLTKTNSFTNTILEAPNGTAVYDTSTITVKSGLKILIPDGKTETNKLKNIEYTTTEDISKTITDLSKVKTAVFLYNNGTIEIVNQKHIFYKNTTPSTLENNVHWYNTDENRWYRYILSESRWDAIYAIPIANAEWDENNSISSFTASKPINLVKNSDLSDFYTIKGILPKDLDYVVERYKSGNEFYTIYKSGWTKQGGYLYSDGDSYANFYVEMERNYVPTAVRYSAAGLTTQVHIWVRGEFATTYLKVYSTTLVGKYWTVEGYKLEREEI